MSDLRRNIDLMVRSAEAIGYRRDTPAAKENETGCYSTLEITRQLRSCMREIVELRGELAAERDSRTQLISLASKRAREELLVELRVHQHAVQQDLREAQVRQQEQHRVTEINMATDKRKIDDALRSLKVLERAAFDDKDASREQIEELRGRVDAAVALCSTSRVDIVHELEKERSHIQRRLDAELVRYSELYHSHHSSLEAARSAVATGVDKLAANVRSSVEESVRERVQAVTRDLIVRLEGADMFRSKCTADVETLRNELGSLSGQLRRDVSAAVGQLSERLNALEAVAPVLTARAERFERKVDDCVGVMTKLNATSDVVKETSDRTAARTAHTLERIQKVEESMADRDARITSLEAQTIALTGIESVRVELEAAKRGISRVENAVETAVKTSLRTEKTAEDCLRIVDDCCERVQLLDRRVGKSDSRVEQMESKLTGFHDRFAGAEAVSEGLQASVATVQAQQESHTSKQSALDIKLSSLADRADAGLRDLRSRVGEFDSRVTVAGDSASKAADEASQASRECERLGKKVTKVETTTFNLQENNHGIKTTCDSLARAVDSLGTRHEALERQTAAAHASSTQALEVAKETARQLTAQSDRLDAGLSAAAVRSSLATAPKGGVAPEDVAALCDARIEFRAASLGREIRQVRSDLQSETAVLRDDLENFKSVHRIDMTRSHSQMDSKIDALRTELHSTIGTSKSTPLNAPVSTAVPSQGSMPVGTFQLHSHQPPQAQEAEFMQHGEPVRAASEFERPPLAPPSATAQAPSVSLVRKLPTTANPYETDGSGSRTPSVASVVPLRRQPLLTEGTSPSGDSQESPSLRRPHAADVAGSTSDESTPGGRASFSPVRTTSVNPYADTPTGTPLDHRPVPHDAPLAANDFDASEDDDNMPEIPELQVDDAVDAVSAPTSRPALPQQGTSPQSSKATDDVSLSLTATTNPTHRQQTAAVTEQAQRSSHFNLDPDEDTEPTPERQQQQPRPAAVHTFDDTDSDQDEGEGLDDDDLAMHF
jgi:ABC-type transporter Mla subunit MlaD